jgi:hypothetical protein
MGQVSALKERTEKKLEYAELMLKELSKRASIVGRGDSFERAHEEAVLFHVIGAKDAFLQEINAAYGLGLSPSQVTENNLAIALVKKGNTCPALQELMLLKEDESSWLSEANRLRNQGTHRGGLARTSFVGGEHDDEVFYKDPKDPSKYIAEVNTYVYLEHSIQEMGALILRLRATL